jgi:glycogen synthase
LTIKQALRAYRDSTSWQQLMRNGMSKDFSWGASAKEYVRVYERARQIRTGTSTPSSRAETSDLEPISR